MVIKWSVQTANIKINLHKWFYLIIIFSVFVMIKRLRNSWKAGKLSMVRLIAVIIMVVAIFITPLKEE